MERGAVTLEPYDLSNAVQNYAMPLKWVDENPFCIRSGHQEAPSTGRHLEIANAE